MATLDFTRSRRFLAIFAWIAGLTGPPMAIHAGSLYTAYSSADMNSAVYTNDPVQAQLLLNNINGKGAAPARGNFCVVLSNGFALHNDNTAPNAYLRANASGGAVVFSGDSLSLTTNSALRLKNAPATFTFTNSASPGSPGLILAGGCLEAGDDILSPCTVAGVMQAAPGTASYITTAQGTFYNITARRPISITATVSGSGDLMIVGGQNTFSNVTVSSMATNPFSGRWIVEAGWLVGLTPGSLGSNSSVIVDRLYPMPYTYGTGVQPSAKFEPCYDFNTAGTLILTNGGQTALHQNCVFGAVCIEGATLSTGTHSYTELNTRFPANFPSGGSGGITVHLLIPSNGPPAVASVGQPVSQTRSVGQSAQFSVTAGGSQPLSYQWRAGATNSGGYTNLTNGGQFSGATNATLTISNLTLANTADLVVVITNSVGSITSGVATLTVLIGQPLSLALTTSTAQQEDWNTPSRWSDGNPASVSAATNPGSTYDVPANCALRSPDLPLGSGSGTLDDVFPGDLLTIEGNGVWNSSASAGPNIGALLLKHNSDGTNYFKKLVMNGGQLDQAETGLVVLAGELDILANTPIYNDNTEDRGFRVDSWLTGNGTVEFHGYNLPAFQTNYTSTLNITGSSNTFSGQWNVVIGTLLGSGPGSLGTNTISVGANGVLETTYDINNPNGNLILNGHMFLHEHDTFATVTVGGAGLAAGTYTFAQLNAAYPTNFPASWTPQQGAQGFSTGSGSITALATPPPPSTNAIESSVMRLTLNTSPFSFTVVEKSTGTVLLSQTANTFTFGSSYAVSAAGNIASTETTLDADLFFSGTSSIAHVTFGFVRPDILQVTLSSPNNASQVSQQFADQGEEIFGGFECPTGGTLSTRNFSHQLSASFGVNNIVNACGAKAPFYLTTRHYGIYAESDALGTMTFAQGGYTSFSFNVPQLTFDIIYGSTYADIMAGFNSRSGGALMPPIWMFDSIWWKDDDHGNFHNGVSNAQGNVLDTAVQLTNYQIYASAEWIDRPYGTSCGQGDGGWGNLDFDSSFPNPAQMVSDLHARGINLMLWITDLCWCNLYNQGLTNGYLFSTGNNTAPNLQNTNAYYWFQTNLNAFVNLGVLGYKIDRGDQGELPDSVNNLNDTLFQQMAYTGLSAAYPTNCYTFSRCASDTGRKYTGIWNGDTYCTFSGLQYSIISGLRAGIINFPMWGSDTGGYISTPTKPTEELFARWMEFSAYSTIMEIVIGNSRTPWYDYTTNLIAITRAQAAAHHDLIPYSRSHLYQATQTGMPVMRPIMFAYPDDTNLVTTITNCEYMFGGQILVAPVITAGATTRDVYLPAGKWLDYNTRSNLYSGPANLTASAPLDIIPMYINEGAIIPRGDIFQGNNLWTPNWAPQLRLEFFPSDNFGSSFPYYTGSTVRNITCSNQNHTLTIQFGDLGVGGNMEIYVQNPGAVTRNGVKLNFGAEYTYNSVSNLLRVPFSGPTTLVVSDATSLFSAFAPVEAWRYANFGNTNSPAVSALSADPDGDSVPNFLEYAFGLNPLLKSTNGLPTGGLVNDSGANYLALTFQRATNATDCTFTVQVSPDLRQWLAGSSYAGTNVVSATAYTTELSRVPANGAERITVRDNVPVNSAPRRFMRVRVTDP